LAESAEKLQRLVDVVDQLCRDWHLDITQKRLPPNIKLLVWLGQGRPLLEYGAEVWQADANLTRQMESVQTQAGILALRLNKHTKLEAVRALMHCPSLQARWDIKRLLYCAKLLSLGHERAVRTLTRQGGAQQPKELSSTRRHWADRITRLINSDEDLRQGFDRLTQIASQHDDILPMGNLEGEDPPVNPMRDWELLVKRTILHRELTTLAEASQAQNSSIKLLARAFRDDDTIPKLPLTKHANNGPAQVCLRLMAGTGALHKTLHHYGGRATTCPHPGCDQAEDEEHFILHCPLYARHRATMLTQFRDQCNCSNEVNCFDFFTARDDLGKAALVAGGRVDQRTLEGPL
jgi:hypothetical protein